MTDVATSSGIDISIEVLQRHLGGVPTIPVVAKTGRGLDNLKEALEHIDDAPAPAIPESWPALSATADELAVAAGHAVPRIDVIQALLHPDSPSFAKLESGIGAERIAAARAELFGDEPPQAAEYKGCPHWSVVRGHAVRPKLAASFRCISSHSISSSLGAN